MEVVLCALIIRYCQHDETADSLQPVLACKASGIWQFCYQSAQAHGCAIIPIICDTIIGQCIVHVCQNSKWQCKERHDMLPAAKLIAGTTHNLTHTQQLYMRTAPSCTQVSDANAPVWTTHLLPRHAPMQHKHRHPSPNPQTHMHSLCLSKPFARWSVVQA